MVENDPFFKENVRNAFKKAKEDINRVDNEILSLKNDIFDVKSKIQSLKEEISKIIPFLEKISLKTADREVESSTGNEGVLSKQASKQAIKHSTIGRLEEAKDIQESIKAQFQSLTKKEFLTFLTIYQLEEELEVVRFTDLSKRLSLSEGCIRAYVTKLFEKNIPITKKKINNRIVDLSLLPEFRKLGLKKALTNMYYELDPMQKSLSDQF